MSAEENKALVLQAFEALNRGDMESMFSFFDPACSYPDLAPSGFPPTLEGHKQLLSALSTTFTERHHTVEKIVAEGDTVMVWLTEYVTHSGPWRNVPATNKRVSFKGVECFRLAQNKVIEFRFIYDTIGLLQQIGME
ncbi:ester cyclase [Dictyobacter kobayashii]|uniref:SnoaL-like domain-containing protein n=1 Tax=Dictyobacter kobayashii TaxID=2014872 RepID=A0A402ALE5_9CHLR|nr:ester cyclase [Dictyobacter kobayashii]GCE19830.1 hypothetical protein KDK_36300 [Dictyobacter kobayashii]